MNSKQILGAKIKQTAIHRVQAVWELIGEVMNLNAKVCRTAPQWANPVKFWGLLRGVQEDMWQVSRKLFINLQVNESRFCIYCGGKQIYLSWPMSGDAPGHKECLDVRFLFV